MRDLESSEDCGALVRRFYGAVQRDGLLGPVFASRVDDWEEHLDTMRRFWSNVMLGQPIYHGNPLVAHLGLRLEPRHFERWLSLWREAVDELFRGPTASAIIERAQRIAAVLSRRLEEVS